MSADVISSRGRLSKLTYLVLDACINFISLLSYDYKIGADYSWVVWKALKLLTWSKCEKSGNDQKY